MLFHHIIIHIYQRLQNQRTIAAVYHLLRGKPSIQTLQDIHLFQLNDYFGIYKTLTKSDFEHAIDHLVSVEYLRITQKENQPLLTKKAINYITEQQGILEGLFFNGERFKQIDLIFLDRLLLLTQVWTNSSHSHFTFIPVIENRAVELWVKNQYKKTKDEPERYLRLMHSELRQILLSVTEQQAEIFVYQLSGYENIGKTLSQISVIQAMSRGDISLLSTSTLHTILERITSKPEDFSVLYSLMEGLQDLSTLSHSAATTAVMLKRGQAMNEIAISRKLALNTIYDHVVEIAIHDLSFDITSYVTTAQINEVIQATRALNSFKLKDIKTAVADNIDYFHIRLILTKLDDYL